MRISYWSSDVCSSDLGQQFPERDRARRHGDGEVQQPAFQLERETCGDRVRHRRAGPSRYTRLMPGSVNDGRSPFVVQRDCVDTSSGWRIDSPSSGVVLGSFALIFASVFLPTRPSHCPYWPGNSRFWKARSEEHTSELQSLMR